MRNFLNLLLAFRSDDFDCGGDVVVMGDILINVLAINKGSDWTVSTVAATGVVAGETESGESAWIRTPENIKINC